jgi:uncharacterized protein with NRDE domain
VCLILFAYRAHAEYPLVLAANRDEFFARPTLPAAPWSESAAVVGGRDLDKGGSWLGISASGRLAAVTNFRDGSRRKAGIRSRGLVVSDFLLGSLDPVAFLHRLDASKALYDEFNLIVAADSALYHYASITGRVSELTPGIYGLSNHLLDTPWPKVEHGKAAMATLLEEADAGLVEGLFQALGDTRVPPDEALPRTGVSRDWERVLSTAFISAPDYGTRASTVLLVDRRGDVSFFERNFAAMGAAGETRAFRLSPAQREAARVQPLPQ